jgi:hypothetical protein
MLERLLSPENHLVALARSGQLRWPRALEHVYALAVLAFGLISLFVGQLLIVAPLLLFFMTVGWESPRALWPNFNPDAGMSLQLVLSFAPLYFLVWAWVRMIERRPLRTTGLERPGWLFKYVRGLIVGWILFSGAIGVMGVTGLVSLEPAPRDAFRWSTLGGVLLVFVGWVVQGGAEEILTRGFLLPVLSVRWGVGLGILASSGVFALLHSFNPNLNPIALFNLFLFGVFTAFYALQEGGIWGVFAIHSSWNWAQGNLYGLEVSGQEFDSSVLVNLRETGPDWLTGGSFGPEGGIIVTLVITLGLLYTIYGMRPGSGMGLHGRIHEQE